MSWQYSTILFEFRKDGLLGDRYIDDDDMEKVLNEQGRKGWELVSVTPVQEGLLSFFKRPLSQHDRQLSEKSPSEAVSPTGVRNASAKPAGQQQTPAAERISGGRPVKSGDKPGRQQDVVGDIKIS